MRIRFAVFAAAGALALAQLAGGDARAEDDVRLISSADSAVLVYGATWCGPCKMLERGLRERKIPFDVIDVDENPKAYEVARKATGQNVVPITSVTAGSDVVWVVGADVDGVEKAYRGQ